MSEFIGVSVFIATYNQEKYIADAIEGALKQKTTFKYEILIHDDASTDGTTSIVKEYAKKFPGQIVAYYEEVNMFAHCEVFIDKILSQAKGKYLAICDGDDYWIDENKLQLQFDFMENNPDFSLCAHNTKIIDMVAGKESICFARETKELLREEVIENAGAIFHASSHFFRLAPWYNEHKGNDFADMPRVLWCCNEGRIMCFSNVMSVYRVHANGSWSSSITDIYSGISDLMCRVKYYEQYDKMTYGRWHHSVKKISDGIKGHVFELLRPSYRQFSAKKKIAIILGMSADLFGIWPLTYKIRKWINKAKH